MISERKIPMKMYRNFTKKQRRKNTQTNNNEILNRNKYEEKGHIKAKRLRRKRWNEYGKKKTQRKNK